MNIAIFGYYNFFNAGDDRIQHCLKRIFQGHIIVFFPHFLPPPSRQYLNTFDWIIIGGGGLVMERVGIWFNMSDWLSNLHVNLGVIGLGVNRIDASLQSEIDCLLTYTQFFFVRDKKSKQLLNNDPRIEVHTDLTWCFPLKRVVTEQSNTVAINLTPCQEDSFDPGQWLERCGDRDRIVPFPLYFTKNRDYVLLRQYFGSAVPPEFDLQPLINSKILVACRYHAIVFAMQLGKPFIAINYSDKVKRLVDESGLEHLCLELDEHEQLPEKIAYIESHYLELLEKIYAYAQRQEKLAQTMLDSLYQYIADTPPKESRKRRIINKIKSLLHYDRS